VGGWGRGAPVRPIQELADNFSSVTKISKAGFIENPELKLVPVVPHATQLSCTFIKNVFQRIFEVYHENRVNAVILP
jgi:hypothetical protein